MALWLELVSTMASSSTPVSSLKKYDNGPLALGVTTSELELVFVVTAFSIPERAIRREEPSMLFISMPVLIPVSAARHICGCDGCSCLCLYALMILLTDP